MAQKRSNRCCTRSVRKRAPILTLRQPVNLLDLPQELLDKIFRYVYVENYKVEAHISSRAPNDTRRPKVGFSKPPPSCAVELVSKRFREHAHLIRKNSFNGNLFIYFTALAEWSTLRDICLILPSWIQERVISLVLHGFSHESLDNRYWTGETWQTLDILTCFPRLSSVQLNVKLVHCRQWYNEHSGTWRHTETTEWRNIMHPDPADPWADDRRTSYFLAPAYMINPLALASYMRDRQTQCDVFMRTSIRWLTDADFRLPLHEDHQRFLVTPNNIQVVQDGAHVP